MFLFGQDCDNSFQNCVLVKGSFAAFRKSLGYAQRDNTVRGRKFVWFCCPHTACFQKDATPYELSHRIIQISGKRKKVYLVFEKWIELANLDKNRGFLGFQEKVGKTEQQK